MKEKSDIVCSISVEGDIYEWSRSKLVNLKSKVQMPEKAYLCCLYSSLVWNTVMIYLDIFFDIQQQTVRLLFF